MSMNKNIKALSLTELNALYNIIERRMRIFSNDRNMEAFNAWQQKLFKVVNEMELRVKNIDF